MGGAGQLGYGPLAYIDGPPPLPPLYGLIQAAAVAGTGVRVVPDVDEDNRERWINGVGVHGYPPGCGHVWDPCGSGTLSPSKSVAARPDTPNFGAMQVYFAEECTTRGNVDQERYRARALAVLAAVEGAAVESEFLTGTILGALQPHLEDGQGTFPNGDGATSPAHGIALLDVAIAESCRFGVIHVSPLLLPALKNIWAAELGRDGVYRSPGGNTIIPGFGYVDGTGPQGHIAATGTESWAYATGPIDIRRSEMFVVPESASEAVDRDENLLRYTAERYYLVDWDSTLQAAVNIDACVTTCEPPA